MTPTPDPSPPDREGISPVSVVIPTHNRPELVIQAVRSALGQTRPPAEVIVVDDGTEEADAEALATALDREGAGVRLIRNPEARGGSAARNQGWRAARSRWIAFLDDDDLWVEEKLECQVAALERDDAEYGWTAYRIVERDTMDPMHEVHPPPLGPAGALARSDRCSSTLMVRREVLEEVGGFDESLPRNQDWDLFVRLAYREPGSFVDRVLMVMRHHYPDPDKCIVGRHMLVEKWADEIADLPRAERTEVWAEHHWLLWSNHARKWDRQGEWRHILKALRLRPFRLRYWRSAVISLLHTFGWKGRHTSRIPS